MRLLEQLAPGPSIGWLVLMVVVQVTVVILAAELVARTLLKHRAALRHGLWLCWLVCVLLSPLVPVLLDEAGIRTADHSLGWGHAACDGEWG